jgi:hypothetical protein
MASLPPDHGQTEPPTLGPAPWPRLRFTAGFILCYVLGCGVFVWWESGALGSFLMTLVLMSFLPSYAVPRRDGSGIGGSGCGVGCPSPKLHPVGKWLIDQL